MRQRLLRELEDDLQRLAERNLRRRLRPIACHGRMARLADGRELLNLAGNDYVGLAEHPLLKQAAIDAVDAHGTGAGASRLVTGTSPLHRQVERRFAAFKHAQAALLLPTGYMANLAVLTALAHRHDLICADKLDHASLIDAAHASGAAVRTYPHLQTDKLERLLARHLQRHPPADNAPSPRRFIVTDAVFSMDGDVANLPALCELADQYDATLIVDEAHATGVLGDDGSGLCQAQGVADRVPIVISTASKALGGLGGIVSAPQPVIDTLINHARPAIYTTAVPAAQAAVIGAALQVVRDEPQRRQRLADLSQHLRNEMTSLGWALPDTPLPTPILPLIVGESERALALADHLQNAGILAVAIRPPTVPPRSARVRISLRADLTDRDVRTFLDAVRNVPA